MCVYANHYSYMLVYSRTEITNYGECRYPFEKLIIYCSEEDPIFQYRTLFKGKPAHLVTNKNHSNSSQLHIQCNIFSGYRYLEKKNLAYQNTVARK